MILIEVPNSAPENFHVLACKIDSCTVQGIEDTDFCDCECNHGCTLKLPVFAKAAGTDYENDRRFFSWRVLSQGDTASMELYKLVGNTWELQTILNNNAYGFYYPLGTWTLYPGQELQFGYELDWESVLINFGHGEYRVKADMSVLGQPVVKWSDIYYLLEFSEQRADQTFVMRTIMNGKIRRSPFDWTGLEREQWIRLPGYFGFRTPTFITEEYLLNNYKEEQIQDEIRDEYTLWIERLLDASVSEEFIYHSLLANEIFFTDYNLCNTDKKKFTNFPVKPSSIDEPFEDRYTKGRFYKVKFTDRFKDIFKRNQK